MAAKELLFNTDARAKLKKGGYGGLDSATAHSSRGSGFVLQTLG